MWLGLSFSGMLSAGTPGKPGVSLCLLLAKQNHRLVSIST